MKGGPDVFLSGTLERTPPVNTIDLTWEHPHVVGESGRAGWQDEVGLG